MKRFLTRIFLFFLIIIVIDLLSGKMFDYMLKNAKGGDNARNFFINTQVDTDILIFGSSRATHHYNPFIFQDSLKMTCFNAGQDGNGAIYSYARYQLICQRYAPKLVIYDVLPMFDLTIGEDNHRYLGSLRPYYSMAGIPEVFDMVDKTEKIKMKSNLFRYNSQFLQIVNDYVHPIKSAGEKGYLPLNEKFDTMKVVKNDDVSIDFDTLKILCLNKFVKESPTTRIVFCVSPIWYGMNPQQLQPIRDICEKEGLQFVDFSNDPKYVHNNNLFRDGLHLNSKGADMFSKELINVINNERDAL